MQLCPKRNAIHSTPILHSIACRTKPLNPKKPLIPCYDEWPRCVNVCNVRRGRNRWGESYLRSDNYQHSLRVDLYRRAVLNQAPDLVDLAIGHGDAAICPVLQTMRRTDRSVAVRQSVNINVVARRDVRGCCLRFVLLIRIRDVEGLVELRVGIARIQNVVAFRSAVIALPLLWSDRFGSECNLILLYYLAATQKLQGSFVLDDDHLVDTIRRVLAQTDCNRQERQDDDRSRSTNRS